MFLFSCIYTAPWCKQSSRKLLAPRCKRSSSPAGFPTSNRALLASSIRPGLRLRWRLEAKSPSDFRAMRWDYLCEMVGDTWEDKRFGCCVMLHGLRGSVDRFSSRPGYGHVVCFFLSYWTLTGRGPVDFWTNKYLGPQNPMKNACLVLPCFFCTKKLRYLMVNRKLSSLFDSMYPSVFAGCSRPRSHFPPRGEPLGGRADWSAFVDVCWFLRPDILRLCKTPKLSNYVKILVENKRFAKRCLTV